MTQNQQSKKLRRSLINKIRSRDKKIKVTNSIKLSRKQEYENQEKYLKISQPIKRSGQPNQDKWI